MLFRSLILATLLATSAVAAPLHLTQQGRLLDSTGTPIDGPHDVSVTLYDAPTSGNVLWSDTMSAVDFTTGYYAINLGSGAPLSDSDFDGDNVWLALSVDSAPALSRVKLASVPYALQAQRAASAASADSVSGGVVDASELRINGNVVIDSAGDLVALSGGSLSDLSCTTGQVATYNGATWGCGPGLPAHTHDADDITSGTLAIGRLPVGSSAAEVAAGNHGHALSDGTGVLDAGQMPTAAVNLASGTTVNNVAISTAGHDHALADGTGVLDAGQMPTAAVNLASGTTVNNVAISTAGHGHALADGTGTLSAGQMPTAAVDLAAASTVDGVAIATANDVTAAIGGIARHHYTGSITVGGDANTYYPVCVSKPSETTQLMCDIRVFRGYNQTAPSTWNTASHKGGLAFWLQTQCGSAWSGQPRSTQLKWFEQTYSTMVAKYTTPVEGCSATCIYLRGGGAYYSFEGNFSGIQTPTAYMDLAGTRDMCSPNNPGYNPPLEIPVTTTTLVPVDLN